MTTAGFLKTIILTSTVLILSETSARAEPLAECITSVIEADDNMDSESADATLTNIAASILNYHYTQGPDATKLQLRLAALEAESETIKNAWMLISSCYDLFLFAYEN